MIFLKIIFIISLILCVLVPIIARKDSEWKQICHSIDPRLHFIMIPTYLFTILLTHIHRKR